MILTLTVDLSASSQAFVEQFLLSAEYLMLTAGRRNRMRSYLEMRALLLQCKCQHCAT